MDEPTCRCGYKKGHLMVSAKRDYSAWGWFMVMYGATVPPRKVQVRCRVCKTVLEEVTDTEELKRYTSWDS